MNLSSALAEILKAGKQAGRIFVACDPFAHLTIGPNEGASPEKLKTARLLRDVAQHLRGTTNLLILLGPSPQLPPDAMREVANLEFPLPNEREIRDIIARTWKDFVEEASPRSRGWDEAIVEQIIRACLGLTEVEIEDALALALHQQQGLTLECVATIHRVKQLAVNRTTCLEAIPVTSGLNHVGGLDVLKGWVTTRQRAFSEEARRFGVEPPKGLLTVGVPGGGKGVSARAVASAWGLPLIRLDWGALMGKWLGESEGNLRSALRIAEATSPCVLWIDEIEKAMGQGGGDGGTATRVFGAFLTWMQERQSSVVCYFTANDISAVPPELMRKGRLDEIFFIDLPTQAERKQILSIHLAKRKRNPAEYPLDELATACKLFVGAEIEQGVQEALVSAFAEGSTVLTTQHLVEAFGRTLPMVRTQPERLQKMRKLVDERRAVRASTQEAEHEEFTQILADAMDANREKSAGVDADILKLFRSGGA